MKEIRSIEVGPHIKPFLSRWILLLGIMMPTWCWAGFSGFLLLSTDYLSGGYSKSNGNPVVQVNLDYELKSGVYTGLWISPVDFDDDAFSDRSHIEIVPYLGWTHLLQDSWRIDVSSKRYLFDNKLFGRQSDYNLFSLQLAFQGAFSASVAWSPDYYGLGEPGLEYGLFAQYPLSDTVDVSAGVGYMKVNRALEYDSISSDIGVSWHIKPLSLDVRYITTREIHEKEHALTQFFEPHFVRSALIFSLSYGF